jgi:hypothetical protein
MSVVGANMLTMQHDWLANLTGFRETSYDATRDQLFVGGDELGATVNGKRYGIGTLEVPTLAELRGRVEVPSDGRTTVRCVTGEARAMHADSELEGALFQVASQFNLLEMTGPSITPEDGVRGTPGITRRGRRARSRPERRPSTATTLRPSTARSVRHGTVRSMH